MPVFPSADWVGAWLEVANASSTFRASGEGWDGTVGLVVEADPGAGVPNDLYVRLSGRHGRWLEHVLGTQEKLLDDAEFTVWAPYCRWKQLIRGELNPIKGMVQGKITVRGQLSAILRWSVSVLLFTELAGQVDTQFVDETQTRREPG